MKFNELSSWKKLEEAAKKPVDLSKKDFLTEQRMQKMTIQAGAWKMLYATEAVNEDIIKHLCSLAHEANVWEKMDFLQNMEVMNFINNYESEDRRVGHTAIRDVAPSSEDSEETQKVSKVYEKEVQKLREFLQKSEKFQSMIVIGIGGSYLGTKAIYESLKACQKGTKKLYFASNVDSDKAHEILQQVDLKTTLVAVTSKSGGTLEIVSQKKLFEAVYVEKGLDPKEHFIAITGEGSEMDNKQEYLEVFYLWDFIGGRYSVSSMVGAVPLMFIFGYEMWMDFLKGLHDMDLHARREKDPLKNLPLWGALLGIWNRNFLNYATFAIVPYAQGMQFWSAHLQQLFMESNGKSVAQIDGSFIDYKTCPVLWGTVGTEGQHSYYQCIHQGTDIIPMEFIGFLESQFPESHVIDGTLNQEKLLANMMAQSIGLATGKHADNHNKYFPGNRPNHTLIAKNLNAYTLGNLLAYHEHYVTFQGFIWGINSFDQEGVQLGKVLAKDIIDLFQEKRDKGSVQKTEKNALALAMFTEMEKMKKKINCDWEKAPNSLSESA